jgi:hypothetical protein
MLRGRLGRAYTASSFDQEIGVDWSGKAEYVAACQAASWDLTVAPVDVSAAGAAATLGPSIPRIAASRAN